MPLTKEILARRIRQARGMEKADLVVKGAHILNTATGTIEPGDIAICDDAIVAVYGTHDGAREIDGRGCVAVPGLIDTHVHVESSMVTPFEFERLVLPRGTTTAICDPHEIANVLGAAGIRYFLEAASLLRMTLRVNLSSCVPATDLETSGARLDARDLVRLGDHPMALGLAEMMNYPGVLAADETVLEKLIAFDGRHVDGHAPLVRGSDLDAYLACAIRTDHESTGFEEGEEKLRKGMHVLMREGSIAKDVAALAPLITEATWSSLAFCTDDRNPLEILEEGHIDFALRTAITQGAPTIPAYRAATLGAARAFGLWDRGIIAPGRRADIVLVSDLESVAVDRVICGGRIVDEQLFAGRGTIDPVGYNSVQREPVSAEDLRVPASGPELPAIGVRPMSLLTDSVPCEIPTDNGYRTADPANDLHKVCVLERHGRNGNIGRGFVRGFGGLEGALAATVGHDSHNLTVVGDDDADMALAANRLIELQGGVVVVSRGRVAAELALPVAGLMSDAVYETVETHLRELRDASRKIGCGLAEPFLQMAFLPLPVIPHLKITDLGMVDVDRFALLDG